MPIRGTTFAAGRAVAPRAGRLRQKVFLYLLARGTLGATIEEMENALTMPGNTLRPRRVELEAMGMVEDSKVTRPTISGKSAIVWRVPPAIAAKAISHLKTKGLL